MSFTAQSIERLAQTHGWGNQSLGCRIILPIVGQTGWERGLMRRWGDGEAIVGGRRREFNEFLDGGEGLVLLGFMRFVFGYKLVGSIPIASLTFVDDRTSYSRVIWHWRVIVLYVVSLTLTQPHQSSSSGQRVANFICTKMVHVHVELDFRSGNSARCMEGDHSSLAARSFVCRPVMIFRVIFVVGGSFHRNWGGFGFATWFGLRLSLFRLVGRSAILNKVGTKQGCEIVSNLVTLLQTDFARKLIWDPVSIR